MKKVVIISLIAWLVLFMPIYAIEEIKNPDKFWIDSEYVVIREGVKYNPTYTFQWVDEIGIFDYDISSIKNSEKIIEAKELFKEAKKNKEICESLFIFDKNNRAQIKIDYRKLNSLSDEEKEEIYRSSANSFMKKYIGYYIERQEHTGKRKNRTYTYYTYHLVRDTSSLDELTYEKVTSMEFMVGLAALSTISPQIFLITGDNIPVNEIYGRINSQQAVENCKLYSENMDKALNTLYLEVKKRAEISNKYIKELDKKRRSLEYMGLCEENYGDIGSLECRELNNYIVLNEEGFGKYAEQREKTKEYVNWLDSLKKGEEFEEEYMNLMDKIDKIEEEIEKEIKSNLKLISIKRKELRKSIERLDKEEIGFIKGSSFSIDTTFLETSIGEDYEFVSKIEKEVEEKEKELNVKEKSREKGWASALIIESKELLKKISKARTKADMLIDKAEGAIEMLREEVMEKKRILDNEGYDTSKIRDMLEEARNEKTLGGEYIKLEEAYKELILLELEEKDLQTIYEAEKSRAMDVIEKAKKDMIDVFEEESMFSHYSSIENKRMAIDGFRGIVDSILAKAKLYYNDLQEKRDMLGYYLEGEELSEIRIELEEKEGIYVANGVIDFKKALGSLKYLDELYSSYLKRIEENKDRIAKNKIEVFAFYDKTVYENDEEELEETIRIYNPTPFELTNAEVEFPSLFSGGELREIDGCKVKYRIKNIKPYEIKTITLKKREKPVEIKRGVVERTGKGGYSYITESLFVKSKVCVEEIKLSKRYEKIEGKFKLFKKESLIGQIKRGTYYLEGVVKKRERYKIKKELEGGDPIKYKITISTDDFFDKIEVSFRELGLDKIKSIEGINARYKIEEEKIIIYDVEGEISFIINTGEKSIVEEINRLIEKIKGEIGEEELNKLISTYKGEELLIKLMEKEKEIKEKEKREEAENKYRKTLKEQLERELKNLERIEQCRDEVLRNEYLKRKEEVENLLKDLEREDPYVIKNNYDKRWLEKRNKEIMRRIVKNFYNEYEKYKKKEIFYEKIESLENNMEKLYESHLLSKENSVIVCKAKELENKIKEYVIEVESNYKKIEEENSRRAEKKKEELMEKLSVYTENYYTLKEVEKIPLPSPKEIERDIKEIENELKQGKQNAKKEKRIDSFLNKMKELAEIKIKNAETYYNSIKENMEEKERAEIEKAIGKAKAKIEEKKYGDAVRISKNIMVTLDKKKKESRKGSDYLLLGIIGVSLIMLYFKDSLKTIITNKRKEKKRIRSIEEEQ